MITKTDLIKRLYNANHISFDEMWVLLEETPTIKYVTLPEPDHPVWDEALKDNLPNFDHEE